MEENSNITQDLEIDVSDKTGSSPFTYREGMSIKEEEGQKKTSLSYFRMCVTDRTINNFKFDILRSVYRHAYLNRYIIEQMVARRYNNQNLKSAISWLVKRGMLQRLVFAKEDFASRYFYCVGDGVAQYMKGSKVEGTPCTFDAVLAIHWLCRAQFAACAESYKGFIRSEMHTSFSLPDGKKVFDLGYRATIKSEATGKQFSLIALAVRRNPGWQEALRKVMYIAAGYCATNGRNYPVLICEDGLHMVEVAKVIRQSCPELLGMRIFFTDDHSTAEWRLERALLEWDGNRKFESDNEDFVPFDKL